MPLVYLTSEVLDLAFVVDEISGVERERRIRKHLEHGQEVAKVHLLAEVVLLLELAHLFEWCQRQRIKFIARDPRVLDGVLRGVALRGLQFAQVAEKGLS